MSPSVSGEHLPAVTPPRSFDLSGGNAWVLVLAALLGGGGVGSGLLGSSTSSEIRATKMEIVAEIRRLSDKLDDQARRLGNLEVRINTLERDRKKR